MGARLRAESRHRWQPVTAGQALHLNDSRVVDRQLALLFNLLWIQALKLHMGAQHELSHVLGAAGQEHRQLRVGGLVAHHTQAGPQAGAGVAQGPQAAAGGSERQPAA